MNDFVFVKSFMTVSILIYLLNKRTDRPLTLTCMKYIFIFWFQIHFKQDCDFDFQSFFVCWCGFWLQITL